jgi:hypothetical protein
MLKIGRAPTWPMNWRAPESRPGGDEPTSRCSSGSRHRTWRDPEAKAKVLYAVQCPFHKGLLTGKATHAARRSNQSSYAVPMEDRTINSGLELFMAQRMGAKTIEVKANSSRRCMEMGHSVQHRAETDSQREPRQIARLSL